LENAYPDNM